MKNTIALISLAVACSAGVALAQDHGRDHDRDHIKRVLLISIDGMHAVDYANLCQRHRHSRRGQAVLPGTR